MRRAIIRPIFSSRSARSILASEAIFLALLVLLLPSKFMQGGVSILDWLVHLASESPSVASLMSSESMSHPDVYAIGHLTALIIGILSGLLLCVTELNMSPFEVMVKKLTLFKRIFCFSFTLFILFAIHCSPLQQDVQFRVVKMFFDAVGQSRIVMIVWLQFLMVSLALGFMWCVFELTELTNFIVRKNDG